MKRWKKYVGLTVIIFASLVPVGLWLLMKPLQLRFFNLALSLNSFGQLTALVGMVLFSLTMVLSARWHFWPSFEDYFGGLSEVYNLHHKLGIYSFAFLTLHPLLLLGPFIGQPVVQAALFFVPGLNWDETWGIISLLLMMMFLFITLYSRFRYQVVKTYHQLLGVAFFFGGLHTLVISSDVSSNTMLRWYMIVICSFGVIALLYRTVFGRWLVRRYPYRVSSVQRYDDVVEIGFLPEKKSMQYRTGQFVFMSYADRQLSHEPHPFSLTSSPTQPEIRFASKMLGDYTKELLEVQNGTRVWLEGPYGRFSFEYISNTTQIWAGAGIGITPFVGMARHLVATKTTHMTIDVYYTVQYARELIYLHELQQLAAQLGTMRIFANTTRETGGRHITAQDMQQNQPGFQSAALLICGPLRFMHALRDQARVLGMKKSQIYTEEFKLL